MSFFDDQAKPVKSQVVDDVVRLEIARASTYAGYQDMIQRS